MITYSLLQHLRYAKIYETSGYDVQCGNKRYKTNLMSSLIFYFVTFVLPSKRQIIAHFCTLVLYLAWNHKVVSL